MLSSVRDLSKGHHPVLEFFFLTIRGGLFRGSTMQLAGQQSSWWYRGSERVDYVIDDLDFPPP